MNLHPVTLLFILILAAFFYSQGFLFFFFATIVIGFLLLIASLTSKSAAGKAQHGGGGGAASVYPEKMTIEVKGESHGASGGEKEFAKDVVGGAGVIGNVLKAVWNFNIHDKPKKKEEGGEKKTNGGHR